MAPTKTRIPFPTHFDGPGCPLCHSVGTVQAVEYGRKTWDFLETASGVAQFDGHFDWSEESLDEHIACWNCNAEWAMPERVDYL